MNKSELIDAISKIADITKVKAGLALDAMVKSVTTTLKKGENVTLVGFGTFGVRQRAARNGRNPQTGKPIRIEATCVPVFRAGKILKSEVKEKSGKSSKSSKAK